MQIQVGYVPDKVILQKISWFWLWVGIGQRNTYHRK